MDTSLLNIGKIEWVEFICNDGNIFAKYVGNDFMEWTKDRPANEAPYCLIFQSIKLDDLVPVISNIGIALFMDTIVTLHAMLLEDNNENFKADMSMILFIALRLRTMQESTREMKVIKARQAIPLAHRVKGNYLYIHEDTVA